MTLHRRSLLALAAGALGPSAALLSTGARAADAYPDRALRWIVAYPAAGGSDFLARQIAPQMGKQMGQTIVVDNRPGAAGIIGTEAASKQPGDGYTLLTGDNGAMVFHTALYKTLPYNPTDFVPIGFMASFPLILVVNPNAGFTSAAQFLDMVKRNPGKYSYASPGAGSPHHLAMELLKQMGKTAILVNDKPGFVSNRVLMLTINEAIHVLQDGVAEAKDIDAIFVQCFAHKMGPLATADLIGLDTILNTLEVLQESYQLEKYAACPLLRDMVRMGHIGRKSGKGFYNYGFRGKS